MECEICGRSVESIAKVRIEGAVMQVCDRCARYGERVEARVRPISRAPTLRYDYGGGPLPGEELEFVESFSAIIRDARESKGLKQEELGKLINERASVITRIEGGKMKPDLELAKKLERVLGVKILAVRKEAAEELVRGRKEELTLGDVVKVKKR